MVRLKTFFFKSHCFPHNFSFFGVQLAYSQTLSPNVSTPILRLQIGSLDARRLVFNSNMNLSQKTYLQTVFDEVKSNNITLLRHTLDKTSFSKMMEKFNDYMTDIAIKKGQNEFDFKFDDNSAFIFKR